MNLTYLAFGLTLTLMLCFFLKKRLELTSDLRVLQLAVRAVLQSKPFPAKSRVKHHEFNDILQGLKALNSRREVVTETVSNYNSLLHAGAKITEDLNDKVSIAEKTLDIVLKECAPSAVAAAIIYKESPESESTDKTIIIRGLPKERVTNAIFALYNDKLDQRNTRWGFVEQAKHYYSDLSTFEIGHQYIVALDDQQPELGCLWIGMKLGSSPFLDKHQDFVHGLAKHSAVNFISAAKINARTQREREENSYLLGLSHDMRSPGATALFTVRELLKLPDEEVNQEIKSQLVSVKESLECQLELVENIVELTRFERGLLTPRTSSFRLEDLQTRLIKPNQIKVNKKKIDLSIDLSMERFVKFDAGHLYRVLNNLIENAIKYTEEGYVKVFIKPLSQNHIAILIEDTGIGVPEADTGMLFKHFTNMSNTKRENSLGIGLATSYALAKANDGDISYQARPGNGSIFAVKVVLADDVAVEPCSTEGTEEQGSRIVL